MNPLILRVVCLRTLKQRKKSLEKYSVILCQDNEVRKLFDAAT